jgi:uncharacterized membrane protein YhaH (DUF805 family)
MGFARSIRTCLSKYITFSGRASRSEYWWFFLFMFLAGTIGGVLDFALFGTAVTVSTDTGTAVAAQSQGPIQSLIGLALFLPHLAVAWRRMHDSGRSGLFALFPLLLILGAGAILLFGIGIAGSFQHGGSLDVLFTRATLLIVIPTLIVLILSPFLMLWWLTRPSQPGTNTYGPNPHEVSP